MPDISIIVPTLNEQDGIVFFLKHIQKFRPQCEIILVDGTSSDDTVTLAAEYVDHVIVSPAGRALQMNKGAEVAKASVLLFLHADSFLPDDAVTQVNQAISKAYRWGRFDVRLLANHSVLTVIAWFMNMRSSMTGIATGDQAIFVDKALFEQLGGFQDIALMEDIALSKSLNKVARPCRIRSSVATSARRWLQFGVIKTVLLMWWLRLQYFLGTNPEHLSLLYSEGRFWKR